jgi:hypothetical protein
MDPFARKMIYGSFVYGGMLIVMFAVLTVVYLHTRPRCSDRVVAETTDHAAQWTAALLERRCGAETPFFTHVNLRPAGKDLNTGFFSGSVTEGEVFVLEQDAVGAGVTMHWKSPMALSITCPRCSPSLVRKHYERWGNVIIEYDLSSAGK